LPGSSGKIIINQTESDGDAKIRRSPIVWYEMAAPPRQSLEATTEIGKALSGGHQISTQGSRSSGVKVKPRKPQPEQRSQSFEKGRVKARQTTETPKWSVVKDKTHNSQYMSKGLPCKGAGMRCQYRRRGQAPFCVKRWRGGVYARRVTRINKGTTYMHKEAHAMGKVSQYMYKGAHA
jgi:hypothetical protein